MSLILLDLKYKLINLFEYLESRLSRLMWSMTNPADLLVVGFIVGLVVLITIPVLFLFVVFSFLPFVS